MSYESVCACGKGKKVDYEECFECARETAREEGRLCSCGKFKQARFEKCYDCNQEERDKQSRPSL